MGVGTLALLTGRCGAAPIVEASLCLTRVLKRGNGARDRYEHWRLASDPPTTSCPVRGAQTLVVPTLLPK